MVEYKKLVRSFSWQEAYNFLGINEYRSMNIYDIISNKIKGNDGFAGIRVNSNWEKQTLSWDELLNKSSRLANYLKLQGVNKGDVISVLASKKLEQLIVMLAVWKVGAIYQPLFTAFGPKAIEIRTSDVKPKVVFAQQDQCEKLKEVKSLPNNIITFPDKCSNSIGFDEAVSVDKLNRSSPIGMNEQIVLLYTSGTTGLPKGAMISKRLLLNTYVYMKYGIGLNDDDIFFNGADPGWAYGLYYGLLGPMLFGKTVYMFDSPFNPETYLKFLEEFKITNFAFAPTAYRLIMGSIKEPQKYNIRLSKASSAGEPLNPEVIRWFIKNFGIPVKDHYGQTEVGMVIYNGWGYDAELKIGSAGLPAPGYEVTVIGENSDEGIIAVNSRGEGFQFMGYLNAPEKTKSVFVNEWYLTSDVAKLDNEGYFWFTGRSDDVVKVSGYRVGPFEVESVLIEHPAVLEAAVVGIEDRIRGHILKAYVVLKKDYIGDNKLKEELMNFVKTKYSKHVHLEEIEFVESLPKTESGKIQRFKLKELNKAKEEFKSNI
ncbi:acyl-CoA synthetase/AMP-acid ligase [Caldisphaera lagunensis DSM 15908]|uniref:Acyl-CoA synthetase/AMP-acid ligase n=1 Tax=Caldisphaera lagunensis (strain DSM 15908 / JCM 11604 / ANMR 0165 / IC-154) TaxID=1056495 RepID=L0AA88_CALLD|nr:acyl-CoA synthetase [Caldisphaera lagunensis]AFZ70037.1 acyl-CoA synthetase/AMP-acid ligase [Caldisphaera lagunensis DSM 15908]